MMLCCVILCSVVVEVCYTAYCVALCILVGIIKWQHCTILCYNVSIMSRNFCLSTEWYLAYFLTPYFIFLRDTLSYLALLLFHCVLCFSPSTITFSGLEVAIFLFFLGRLMMEVKQFVGTLDEQRLWKKVCFYFR